MEHMVEYSCMCREKKVALKTAGILPTRARSIVPAQLEMCRKLLYEVMPQLEKSFLKYV